MNGDVQYDLTGGQVSFDTLWRLDQLTATLTDHLGWRVVVEVDPGVVLTATPARDTAPPSRTPYAPQSDENPSNAPAPGPADPEGLHGRTALKEQRCITT